MTEKEKRDQGLLYDANYDKDLLLERKCCSDLCFSLNALAPSKEKERETLLHKILGKVGKNCVILSPFQCDYGYNIRVGDNFFANYNCVILDAACVTIGSNVFIAPNCGIYTATHPLDPKTRNRGLEYAFPVTIGDSVWIGGNVVVLPGVTIGSNTVIGAGSIVTHDIPDGVLAFGNPCTVVRTLV